MKTRLTAKISALFLLAVFAAQFVAPEATIDLARAFTPPGREYLVGATPLGQSVLQLCLSGAGATVALATGALLIALAFALFMTGLLYLVPAALVRSYAYAIDAWLAIPGIFIALSIGYFLPQSFWSVTAALVLSEFAPLQKFLLQRLTSLSHNDYITMAQVMGATPAHTLRLHVLPQLVRETGYLFAVTLPSIALSLSSLEFLGVQTGAERLSLGMQIAVYKDYILLYPYLSLAPVVSLLLTLAALHALTLTAKAKR